MHLMHHHLGMRYKKVQEVPWKANCTQNLILRQRFARVFLDIDFTKKTIINIDETWISQTDFRRRKWSFLGKSDSVPKKNVQPRISMIVGLDTNGSIWLTLLQANSNSSVMELFFSRFVKQLDSERPRWR